MEEFRFYCCPKCETKCETSTDFVSHAFKEHPSSYEHCINNKSDVLKHETDNLVLYEHSEDIKYEENCLEIKYIHQDEYIVYLLQNNQF